jgi:hypothetical protein
MGNPWIGRLFFTALLTAAGCGGGTPQGSEGGACFPNGTCNAGLTCLSNLCVNPEAKPDLSGTSSDLAMSGGGDGATVDDMAVQRRNDAGEPCPGAEIYHPGMEQRMVNTSIPFVGRARDAMCNAITGNNLVWTDSLEGPIGTGETFSFTFKMAGQHTVTLRAKDGMGNTYTATVTFTLV